MSMKLYNEQSVENIAEAIRNRRGLEGYNLYNGYFEWIDYIISSGGEKTYAKNYNTTYEIPIKSPFTISFNKEKIKTEDPYIRIAQYSNDTFVRRYDINGANIDKYTCNDETITKIRISGAKDLLVDDINIIVNEGIEVKPYEPYCRYKISEMAQGVNDLADDLQNYIPKATTEEKQFKAIPLAMSQKTWGNVEQNGEPTPNNPQEVKTMRGVNRIDESKFVNGSINASTGVPSIGATTRVISDYDEVSSNVDYYIESNKQVWFVCEYDKNKAFVKTTVFSTLSATFKSDIETKYVRFVFRNNDNSNIVPADVKNTMLSEGTSPQPYTPYGYLREDFVGANIWNEEWELGAYNETTGKKDDTSNRIRNVDFVKVKPSTEYYITTEADYHKIFYYDINKNFISKSAEYRKSSITTTPDNCYYICFWLYSTDGKYKKTALFEGTSGTYEPYQDPKSHLIYIGDNELLTDDFVEVDEKGNTKITKGWGKVVLTGDEEFVDISTNATRTWYAINFANYNIYEYNNPIAICDVITSKFKARMQSGAFLPNQVAMMTNTKNIFFIFEPNTTEEQARTILRDMPIYFKLAEPTETDLGKHDKLIPLEGTNNIEVQATLEPTEIETTHYYDYRNP